MSSLALSEGLSARAELPAEACPSADSSQAPALVGEKLTLKAFHQLCGRLSGYPFVKVVVDRTAGAIHFINNAVYPFHVDYVAERLMGLAHDDMLARLDELNRIVYRDPDRRYLLGNVALHQRENRRFFTLETVEVDTMGSELLREFYDFTKNWLDASVPLLIKPANHHQEGYVADFDPVAYPRVLAHELFASARFIALNAGTAAGRLRAFPDEESYRRAFATIRWYDIVCMPRVPDDIPRVSGIVNTAYTTPLSHTNVLAHGWNIPNAIQIGAFDDIAARGLDGEWVEYAVERNAPAIRLDKTEKPENLPDQDPHLRTQPVRLEAPETENTPITGLERLRATARFRYGTKAANLGELKHLLYEGSARLTGYYHVPRPPRENLMPYLAGFLGLAAGGDVHQAAWDFLRAFVHAPRGLALPFALQQEFLQSSPRIQQIIGKIKMALELNSPVVDGLCYQVQQMIRTMRLPDGLRDTVDESIVRHLGGVGSFVVRSSSNAEDLDGFSAAGIYESIAHVTTAENIFHGIKEVWASLLSARSVRLRHEAGIALDDCYMGVIVQEEAPCEMGGVLVSGNPTDPNDFRHVYINASTRSVESVVQGVGMPYQYLYNTVEGNGRTISIGDAQEDLDQAHKDVLRRLAFASRLIQSHFSPDYTFSQPLDIEWAWSKGGLYVLQIRPYSR